MVGLTKGSENGMEIHGGGAEEGVGSGGWDGWLENWTGTVYQEHQQFTQTIIRKSPLQCYAIRT